MKRGFLVLAYCLLNTFPFFSQGINWEWAQHSSGPANQSGEQVATDQRGNSYFTGDFDGDSITFDSITLYSSMQENIFVAKYSPSGQILWAKTASTARYAEGRGIKTDLNNNVYVMVFFSGDSITFDSTTLPNLSTVYSGCLILKYDSSGALLWINNIGENGNDIAQGMEVDRNGNVYITGLFYDSVTFGGSTFINSGMINTGDIFIAKYSTSGNLLWAESAGGGNDDEGWAISADKTGSINAMGWFSSDSITFGSLTLHNPDAGSQNTYIVKFDSSGNVLWAKSVTGYGGNYGNAIATDLSSCTYLTGSFASDSIILGTNTLFNVNANNNLNSIFIVKYDFDGNVLWTKCAGGGTIANGYSDGWSLATDQNDNMYLLGLYSSSSITLDSIVLFGSGAYMFTYDSSGYLVCSHIFPNTNLGFSSICVGGSGSFFTASTFQDIIPVVLGNDTLPASPVDIAVLGKLNCSSPTGTEPLTNTPTLLLLPNPFSTQATVQYTLPNDSKNATLIIYDMLGRQRNSYPLSGANGQITINANTLSSGVYLYSLIVDGKTLATKKMVVQE